jgi:L-ribulokinase
MFAAVAAGLYKTVRDAQKNMGSGFITTYYPDSKNTGTYEKLYRKYRELGSILEDQLRGLE